MRAYPTVADLERRAQRRIPRFAYDFLVGGAGDEGAVRHNRAAFDSIRLVPDYLDPVEEPDTSVELIGRTYGLPFGVAPIGLGCIVWPRAAQYLAAAANKANIPFCLSVVASTGIEEAARFPMTFLSGKVTWRHLGDIREHWKGPLIVKGVLGKADAKRCREIGVDGLVVSNHGGRQLEAAVSPLDVLASIKAATGGALPLMLDSGVRNGVDIARAFAKGADFVFLGRAFMLAVAALGQAGGDHVIEILKADLVQAMRQLGCRAMADFKPNLNSESVF